MDDGRREWWTRLARMVAPVFSALAEGRLREAMPVEARDGAHSQRCQFNQLEAVARSLAGAAPWFDCPTIADPEERAERERLRDAARAGLARLVDPADRDMGEFRSGKQPVVDAAFLAHALLRAPQFWADLDPNTRERLHARLRETRSRRPWFNNWLLFGATTEAFLAASGAPDWDPMRIDYALRQHEQWYVGDGIYGDGIEFHADYYNSYVIQPMLLDVLETMVPIADDWAWLRDAARARALRRDPRAFDRPRRHLPAARALARLPLRRVPAPRPDGPARRTPGGQHPRSGARRAGGRDRQDPGCPGCLRR